MFQFINLDKPVTLACNVSNCAKLGKLRRMREKYGVSTTTSLQGGENCTGPNSKLFSHLFVLNFIWKSQISGSKIVLNEWIWLCF